MVVIEFESGTEFRVPQLRKFSVIHDNERVVSVDVLDIALFEFGASKQALVIQADDIDSLIGALGQLDHRATNKKRHRIADAVHAAHCI